MERTTVSRSFALQQQDPREQGRRQRQQQQQNRQGHRHVSTRTMPPHVVAVVVVVVLIASSAHLPRTCHAFLLPQPQPQQQHPSMPTFITRHDKHLFETTCSRRVQEEQRQRTALYGMKKKRKDDSSDGDNEKDDGDDDGFDVSTLNERLLSMRINMMEEEYRRPPNADLSPTEFVQAILDALWNNSDPIPDSGFRCLLRSSTKQWRRELYKAVGVPLKQQLQELQEEEEEQHQRGQRVVDSEQSSGSAQTTATTTTTTRTKTTRNPVRSSSSNEELIAQAVGEAMLRPHNQFRLLVLGSEEGEDVTDADESERTVTAGRNVPTPSYGTTFPCVLNYYDGTCWVECQLRSKVDDALWVAMGWNLEQRESDGAWLVSRIDWQDFRDEYRPGIGREEWERICG